MFVNAPWYGENWYGIRAGCRWPFIFDRPKPPEDSLGHYNCYPFFMGYAANYLAHVVKVGDIRLYDALARNHSYEKFFDNVKEFGPEIVVIETSTPSINNDLQIAERLKNEGMEVALSGPHATVYADELAKLPFVDYVLQGEYEVGAYEMCVMRRKGVYKCRPLNRIDFVPYRDRYSLLYGDGFGHAEKFQWPQLQIWTSRGCPYPCTFCLWRNTMTYGNYRKRSVDSITKEISYCMRELGIRSVLLDDDTVNIGDERTAEISRAMSGLAVEWHAMVRPDACSWEAFMEMRANGCYGLKMGVETFSQRGLDYVKKGYEKNNLIETVDFLVSCGFAIFMSMMDNIPTETDDDRAETKKWIEYFTRKGVSIQHPTCMPLPGTKMFNDLEDKIDKSDWRQFGCFHGEVIK